jgi:hypothetical protein
MTNHYFLLNRFSSFRIGFVCANAPNRSVTRYNAHYYFCASLSPAPLVIPSCTGEDLTAHIIIFVLRHFLAQRGQRACPTPCTSSDPTAHIITIKMVIKNELLICT